MANSTFSAPTDRAYDRDTHFWVKKDTTTGRLIVGIDALLLDTFGDLAYIQLPDVGSPIRRGDAIGSLEAAKMTSEIIAPVSGILIGVNEAVLQDPMKVNQDPYESGWLFAVDGTDWEDEQRHLVHDPAEIATWMQAEAERMNAQQNLDA
ncbi:MAG: glycine cleavage system protein H [candidate division KSB1 bacterium]|nr:glycine cleavage system protein H [candidate division KSB1 bacterium]